MTLFFVHILPPNEQLFYLHFLSGVEVRLGRLSKDLKNINIKIYKKYLKIFYFLIYKFLAFLIMSHEFYEFYQEIRLCVYYHLYNFK